MTREEAIQVLTDIKRIRSDEIAKAIDMAIKALSADVVDVNDVTIHYKPLTCDGCDSVRVVRCKDCRHGWYDDDIEYYTCRHPKGLNEELYGVDFCSYGERKE